MLRDILPPAWRRYVYALYAVAALVVGALNAGGVDTGTAASVLTYIGGALGAVAASNTPTDPGQD